MSDSNLIVIASSGLTAGFALAGVTVVEAASGEDAAREIDRYLMGATNLP